jgi:hypothetical protein
MNSRRFVYAFMLGVIALSILTRFSMNPSRMVSAERMYSLIETLKLNDGEVAMVWLDFGPNTIAENQTQAEVLLEHLLRKRIPTVVISQYVQADVFLKSIPRDIAKRLELEFPGEKWKYGEDWVNAGYKPQSTIFMQSLAKSENITALLGKDINGTELATFPRFANIKGLESIKLVGEVTGLVGVFDTIIQFFQKDGYRPFVVHGCTSITVPEAYIFLDSGQLNGLLEGFAGAAWYSKLLTQNNSNRGADTILIRSTAISVAQLAILLLIVLANVLSWLPGRRF